MEVILLDEGFPTTLGDSGVPRSDTLHLSTIITDIGDRLFNTGYGDSPIQKPQAEFGFVWEELLSLAFAERNRGECIFRPGEVTLDGITGSPDGISVGEWELEEYKATRKSASRGVEDSWYWMTQIKSYIHMINRGKGKMCSCVLRVLYINGDYKPPSPKYIPYRLVFSQLELEENWNMIRNHAESRGWI
jgi:hypothetical protein